MKAGEFMRKGRESSREKNLSRDKAKIDIRVNGDGK
jgi:hypothetical protein